MTPSEPDSTAAAIRSLLARKALADARYRSALAEVLGVVESDVLAMLHLAREGALTASQLGVLLRLTSGGTTALVQRLERLSYVERLAHPHDRRSSLLRLSALAEAEVGAVYAPLVTELDALVDGLPPAERTAVRGFLERVAAIGERHAQDLVRRAADERPGVAGVPVPGLWA
jgi:MarR family multiple antibiotic resistance transcriptional regulator